MIKVTHLPPSRPSPTGEGVNHFPLGGNKKGGKIHAKKIKTK